MAAPEGGTSERTVRPRMNQTGSFSTAQAGPVDTTVRLRLLATTDLHMALAGTDPADDRPVPGLTRLATLIATARSEVPGAICLLLDNGDALQGGALGELAASGDRHPAMHAFRYLGYDALGLGNHDFDLGLDHLGQVLRQAPCPVVCSNLDTAEDRGFAPSAVIERDTPAGTLRVGILSFLPPQTTMWNARHLQGRPVRKHPAYPEGPGPAGRSGLLLLAHRARGHLHR